MSDIVSAEQILEVFGFTQEEITNLGGGSYRAAKAQAEQDLADWLAWAKGVQERLSESMDPHCDRLKIIGYLGGKVEWETLNSPEQAQVMDWRYR